MSLKQVQTALEICYNYGELHTAYALCTLHSPLSYACMYVCLMQQMPIYSLNPFLPFAAPPPLSHSESAVCRLATVSSFRTCKRLISLHATSPLAPLGLLLSVQPTLNRVDHTCNTTTTATCNSLGSLG